MNTELAKQLLEQLAELNKKVSALTAEKVFDTKVPLLLREAAEVCHVELLWLRERVARKEIPAYRSGPSGSWRVFPADVRTLVMTESNQEPRRRKSVLRNVA
jgi:hypothetical protein